MNIRDDQFADEAEHEPPNADLLAGEYVLGVLDAPSRQRAQARVELEPAFARLVGGWEQRFAALLAEIEPVPVPPHVWPRLRRRLGWSPVAGARRGLWQNINVWRGATAAAFAAAAVLAVVFIVSPLPPPAPVPGPTPVVTLPPPAESTATSAAVVTTLAADDGSPAYLATIDVQRSRVQVMPVPAAPDSQGRVPELWLIPAGAAPRSLGVIDTATAREIDIPADLQAALVAGSLLAVTLEPPGGAPQGVPTGPITAKGAIERI